MFFSILLAINLFGAIHPIENGFDVNSHYSISAEECSLKVEICYKGTEANAFRTRLANEGQEAISSSLQDHFSTLFGHTQLKDGLAIEEDFGKNQIRLSANYMLQDLLIVDNSFKFEPLLIADFLPNNDSFSVDYPLEIQETIRLSSDLLMPPYYDREKFEHPSFILNFEAFRDREDLVLNYKYKVNAGQIAHDSFENLLAEINSILSHEYTYLPSHEKISQIPSSFGYIGLGLIIIVGILTAFKAFSRLSEEKLKSNKIKKHWKISFWIFYILSATVVLIIKAPFLLKNPKYYYLLSILLFHIGWGFFLYQRSIKKNGTVMLGATIIGLVPMSLNLIALYFLICSVSLFRLNRTIQNRKFLSISTPEGQATDSG